MALPSGTTGGSGLSRSEAAILAWKKRERAKPVTPGGLSPKIAARVKEILAAKQKKGKPKVAKGGKGKAPKKIDPAKAKEKAARLAERATAKQERDKAKAERATAATAKKQERDKAKVERVAAQASKQQATLKKQKAAAQAQKQKAKAGASAKQAKEQSSAAAAKENAEKPAKEKAANRAKVAQEMAEQDLGLAPSGSAALSDFADGKPLKPETAAEFEKMGLTEKDEAGNHRLTTEGRVAANAMSKGDTRAAIDAISRAGSKKTKADQPKERKAIDMSDLAIKAGARHSRSDIQHLQSIHDSSVACGASCDTESDDDSDMPMDDEEEGVKAIKGIMDNPLYYAQHECSDIMQAANALSTMAMLIQSELVEDDEDTKHVDMLCDAAETLIEFIQSEIDELRGAAKNAANDASMGPMNKAVDDVWLHIDGDAIKALDNDVIRGYAVRFGDADHADLQRDYYTKATDFWLDHFGWPRPITYHHGMDAGTRNDPVVGHWLKAGVDDVGIWMEGQMDRAHAYYKAMKELAARGYIRLSSDSAPQWVIREKQQNGVNEIKRWPLITSSLTVTPMEPRMLPVEVKAYLAEIGYETIDDSPEAINPDAIKADGREMADDERARRLLFELELIELEMETA